MNFSIDGEYLFPECMCGCGHLASAGLLESDVDEAVCPAKS